eukprot:scaffold42733_cov66-Cyclotella_meneghiniana.AAC.2
MPIFIAPNNSASLLNAAIVAPAITRQQPQQTHTNTNSVRRHASNAEDTLIEGPAHYLQKFSHESRKF